MALTAVVLAMLFLASSYHECDAYVTDPISAPSIPENAPAPLDQWTSSADDILLDVEEMDSSDYGYAPYNGPATWPKNFPTCGGSRQSPVDLPPVSQQQQVSDFAPLSWRSGWIAPFNKSLVNNGHTVQVTADWLINSTPSLIGGPLKDEYSFLQLHFHWGSRDSQGSEHTVDGKRMPMEVHIVHFKTSYGTPEVAQTKPDGLAVVAYFYKISPVSDMSLASIVPALAVVRSPKMAARLPNLPLSLMFAPPRKYSTYRGSLTTPKCNQVVTWIVATRPLLVTRLQLQAFRRIVLFDGIHGDNFRPVQPINGRTIFYVN